MRGCLTVFLGCSTSFCYWPHEIALSNQNSVFQKCEPVVFARLVYEMMVVGRHQTALISMSKEYNIYIIIFILYSLV